MSYGTGSLASIAIWLRQNASYFKSDDTQQISHVYAFGDDSDEEIGYISPFMHVGRPISIDVWPSVNLCERILGFMRC